jgi:hypothetical protein
MVEQGGIWWNHKSREPHFSFQSFPQIDLNRFKLNRPKSAKTREMIDISESKTPVTELPRPYNPQSLDQQ